MNISTALSQVNRWWVTGKIDAYAAEILNENLNELTDMIYIFIDEIHTIKDWQIWLKYFRYASFVSAIL